MFEPAKIGATKLMENLHETSTLLSKEEICKLEAAFNKSWIKDTCWPPQQAVWSQTNKSLGQCAVTALIIQDKYGGKIVFDKKNNHFWNILPDGTHHDFTRSQFADGTIFTISKMFSRKEILESKRGNEMCTKGRYNMLKLRVKEFV